MGEVKLTEREVACLRFLSPLMDATPEMIGRALMPPGTTKRGCVTVGNRVADGLSFRWGGPSLVNSVGKLGYAITPAGRAAIASMETVEGGGEHG